MTKKHEEKFDQWLEIFFGESDDRPDEEIDAAINSRCLEIGITVRMQKDFAAVLLENKPGVA